MKTSQGSFRSSSSQDAEALNSLITIGTCVVIIASLYWAQSVLIPVALAMLLTFLLSPVAGTLERIAFGRLPSVILVVVLTFSLLGGGSGGLSLFNSAAWQMSCLNTRSTSDKK